MFDCCLVESSGQKKRQKNGPCLVYQFQRSMESADTSDKEAPPCDHKSNNLTTNEQLKAISMVVDMETKDGIKRCAVMVVTKKIRLAHADLLYYKHKNILLLLCTPLVLIHNSEKGIIISSEIFSQERNSRRSVIYSLEVLFFYLGNLYFYLIFLLRQSIFYTHLLIVTLKSPAQLWYKIHIVYMDCTKFTPSRREKCIEY